MSYSLIFHPKVDEDLKEFSHVQKVLIIKQFRKIQNSPELGDFLGNKNGYNLSGCRKMYADGKKIRIVYKIVEDRIIIEVVAVGNRSEMEVYAKASQRV
ncbi:type II toxin-antitoxin system RelE/ParE family toxin [Sulfurimonas sediminis]|uniref:Type II toxin-antitoxin system RelE/ParE family toxin n=1 Tax=Sulfurimonas sediminis TaxID=2590020 RepID=A0A7M1B4Y5_9BACT|nr:type II toxin-antitoxin system RelE/ParE family toxin [Sulfurimonas sediminis]QOP43762.1 type II toxin-antitoxin system RelE/ParE family toxin [Sulfurimonas sediminis]